MTRTSTSNLRSLRTVCLAILLAGVSLLSTTAALAQVVYNEGFEVTNGTTPTYAAPPFGLSSMPLGWSTSKFCTTVGGYPAGTCNSTAPGFSRYNAGVNPTVTPRTGSAMLGFNSFYTANGEKAYVTTKRLDITNIGVNNITGSIWMYRDSGLYNSVFDSISIHVQQYNAAAPISPPSSLQAASKRVTLNGAYASIPRSYSQTPTCPANSWYQVNFTIPNADVAAWASPGIYIIIMGHSADGNSIYLDDFSVQEYPATAPIVVAGSAGLTLQNTATTAPNNLNQLIVGAKIQTTGTNSTTGTKLTLSNWIFNTNGSTSPPTDITAAKLWWTGGTNAFDASLAVLVGTVTNPWATNYPFFGVGATPSTAFGGGTDSTKWLQYGDNYFWITYDIAPGANSGNYVDAEWVSATYNASVNISLSPQSLTGARLIDLTYCIPSYSVGTAWAGYTNNDYVQCVSLQGNTGPAIATGPLANTPQSAAGACAASTPCGFQSHPPDYEFFAPGQSTTATPAAQRTTIMTAGTQYAINVTCGTWFSSNYIAAWIDYNKNGSFNTVLNTAGNTVASGLWGEKICQSGSLANSNGGCTTAGSQYTSVFTIPTDVIPGNTRLRVREVYATSIIDPCAFATYGETEDYVVTIIPPCAPAWPGWKTWLGFTDDWNNPANWCGGVPTINDNARIPNTIGVDPDNGRPGKYMPKIKSGVIAVAKNLRIESPYVATNDSLGAFSIDAPAVAANGMSTASLTVAEDLSINPNLVAPGTQIQILSNKADTVQAMNGQLRVPTPVTAANEPFSNTLKKRNYYVYTQSDFLSLGLVAGDVVDSIFIHLKRNGTTSEPMRGLTIKMYYTDAVGLGFSFNGASYTGVATTDYRNMPPVVGPAPVTIFGPQDVAVSTFITTSGTSGTVKLPMIANAFKWDGSTNKVVLEMTWDNTSSGVVPFGNTESSIFTQTSTQLYKHYNSVLETRVSSTYPAANFVVPINSLPQTSPGGAAAGQVTWTSGTSTMTSTYANARFAVGQWVSGTGVSVIKSAVAVTAGNATIPMASTLGIQVGMYVSPTGGWAAGVAPQVTAVNPNVSVTVSPAPTITNSYTLTFCPYITGLSSANPPYATITLNCALPGSTTAGNLNFGGLHTANQIGFDYRPNLTFKYRRPYGKFPIEVRKDWVNNGTFIAGISQVSMTTTTAGVVDSMYNATPTRFYDLVINNSDGVKLYGPPSSSIGDIAIMDTLTLTAGRLKANNQLITLGDTAIATAPPGVLMRTGGGIQLDADVLGSDVAPYGRFRWLMGSATGSVDIPLYNQANTYLPFTYNRISGTHVPTLITYASLPSNTNLPQGVTYVAPLYPGTWTGGDGVVDRWYYLSNAGLNPVANLSFRYSFLERSLVTNTNMRIQRWMGTEWERPALTLTGAVNPGGTFPIGTQTHTVGTPDIVQLDGYNSTNFYLSGQWMTIVGQPAPLPISLLNFTATPLKDRVRLDWVTATEVNTSHYEVERTINNNDFLNIGRLNSRGPSSGNLDYRLWDNNPVEGKQYYFLRQYDLDGTMNSYGPVSATFTRDVFDIVNTTVSASEMGVSVVFNYNSDEPVNYSIIDMAGRVVASQNRVAASPGLNVIDIDANLSKGAYQIIITNSEKSVARKFFY